MKKMTMQLVTFAALTALWVAPVTASSDTDGLRTEPMIAKQLQKKIVMLPNYGVFDNIQFEIRDDIVYLSGQASRPTLKKSVEREAAKLEGIKEVVNEIEVLPNSNYDERIRAAAYVSIYGHTVLSRYNPGRGVPYYPSVAGRAFGPSADPPMGAHAIHIVVKNGVITLEGVVANESEKNIAGIQANSVHGAFQVINNLLVVSS